MFDDWTAATDREKEVAERGSLLARESGVGPAQMNDRSVGEEQRQNEPILRSVAIPVPSKRHREHQCQLWPTVGGAQAVHVVVLRLQRACVRGSRAFSWEIWLQ